MLNSCFAFVDVWCFWTPMLFVQLILASVVVNESGLRVGTKKFKRIIKLLGSIYILSEFLPGKNNTVLLIGGFAAKCHVYLQRNEQHFLQHKIFIYRVRWTLCPWLLLADLLNGFTQSCLQVSQTDLADAMNLRSIIC